MRIIDRAPGYNAAIFAEAQALVDDGLNPTIVLALYGEDAAWLEALLTTGEQLQTAVAAIAPRYEFEANLRRTFLRAAAERPQPKTVERAPMPAAGRARMALASSAAAVGAIAAGVLALAVLTSDANAPEIESSLRNADQQVQEVIDRSSRGDLTARDLEDLTHDIEQVLAAAESGQLDAAQKARLRETVTEALGAVRDAGEKLPELNPAVATTTEKIRDVAAAAGIGPVVEPLDEPSPTAEVSPSPASTEPPTPTGTPASELTPTPTAEPSATATGEATSTPEPAPSEPATEGSPSPTGTVGEAETPAPTPAP